MTAAIHFRTDLLRPEAGLCPACRGDGIRNVGVVPYLSTLSKWKIDPDQIRRSLHWDPSEYDFAIQGCGACGTRFVARGCPDLVENLETCDEYFQAIQRDYLYGAQPPMDPTLVREILDASPQTQNPFYARFRKIHGIYRELLAQRTGPVKLLDLGAAYGSVTRFLELAFPQLEVWACELNPVERARLRERYPEMRLLSSPMRCFAPDLRFDMVYCADVVEHVWDLDGFLAELSGILGKDGVAVFATPDGECAEALGQGLDWWGFITPHHCQVLTRRGFAAALSRNGFDGRELPVAEAEEFWMSGTSSTPVHRQCETHPQSGSPMTASNRCRRIKYTPVATNPSAMLEEAHGLLNLGLHNNAIDIYERLVGTPGLDAIPILAELWEVYQSIRAVHSDRYTIYQSRLFEFGISPSASVLDIGSGHHPFPLATHLSDITATNDAYGRAGVPFKHVAGKPVHEFNIESIPFGDNEFDFSYCSHVLEHTKDPAAACKEIMRTSLRGYIETPTASNDQWLCTAKAANHTMSVELGDEDCLVFRPYKMEEMEGIGSDVLLQMHVSPQTAREKAFSAILCLFPDRINTMLYWEHSFKYKVQKRSIAVDTP